MEMTPGFDNRRFQRAPFKRPVKSKTSHVAIYAGNLAQDISQGGMRINSNEFVAVGSHVILQIQLESQTRVLDFNAKVVWVKELPYSDGFQLGLEFAEEAVFEKLKVAQFVVKRKEEGTSEPEGLY